MKTLVALLAVTGLVTSAAFATPKALSSADLDKVSAGSGIMDWFLGGTGGVVGAPTDASGLTVEDVALATDNGTAVDGDDNETGLFVEDNDDTAVALGEGNKASYVYADDSLVFGDDTQLAVNLELTSVDYEVEAEGDNSVAFAGDNNDVLYANIEEDAYGVVAREAMVTDSFNTKDTFIDLEIDIDDSFNVETNSLEVCPSGPVTAIIFAASLDDQNIGANLNVTNASAAVPTGQGDVAASIPIVAGNAIAVTILHQTVINSSVLGDFDF